MRRAFTPIAIAATVTLGIAVVAAHGQERTASRGATLVVTARETSFHTAGRGLGAVTTFTDDLYVHGKKIGRDQVTCATTGPGTFLECYASDLLPKGQIESLAAADPFQQRHFTIAIVGGTGAYRTARGTIAVAERSQTVSTYTYHIDG